MDTNDALKKIVKGAGIASIGLFISKALSYVYRLIIARIGVEQYGIISIALSVFGIFATISLLGISDGVIRFVAFYKGKLNQQRIRGVIISALKITLPFSLVCASLMFFASEWISITFFHNPNLSILLKVFAIGLPFDTLRSILFSSIRAFQKVEYELYGKSLAENLAKVLLTLLAVYLGFGINGAAVSYVTSIFISFILSFYFMEKKVFPIFKASIKPIASSSILLSYSAPLLFTSFIYLIMQWTDTIMLGYFNTAKEVGIYNAAIPLAWLLFFFSSNIRTLFFPVLSELYAQNDTKTFKSVYTSITKWILMINSIIFVFLIVFSKQIISFLFGKAYVNDQVLIFGYSFAISALVLFVIGSGTIIAEFLSPAKEILLVLKKTKLIFLNTTIGSILNIIFNFILIPLYGMIGAAIATGFSYLIIFTLMGVECYTIIKVNPFKRNHFKIIFSIGFILFLILILRLYLVKNILCVIIVCLVLSIVYFGFLFLIKSFEKEDFVIINAVKQKLRFKRLKKKILND